MTIVDFGAFIGCQLKSTMGPKELKRIQRQYMISQYLYFSTCTRYTCIIQQNDACIAYNEYSKV